MADARAHAHIHTTAVAVSKYKKKAKERARKHGLAHSDALDQVSRENGYTDWRHVVACEQASGGEQPTLPTGPGVKRGSLTLIRGSTRAGKTTTAKRLLIESLHAGFNVLAFDVRDSYRDIVEHFDGTVLTLRTSGEWRYRAETSGRGPFVHFCPDLLNQDPFLPWRLPLPDVRARTFDPTRTLVYVDETRHTLNCLPGLVGLIATVLENGGAAIVTGDQKWDASEWQRFRKIKGEQTAIDLSPEDFSPWSRAAHSRPVRGISRAIMANVISVRSVELLEILAAAYLATIDGQTPTELHYFEQALSVLACALAALHAADRPTPLPQFYDLVGDPAQMQALADGLPDGEVKTDLQGLIADMAENPTLIAKVDLHFSWQLATSLID